MRTSIFTSLVSSLIGLTLAACSGASAEPVDQSARAETAQLGQAAPAAEAKAETPGPGRGHRGPHDPSELVQRFDQNHDGQLQASELPEPLRQVMGQADSNGDGVLSVDELKAGQEKMRAEHLAKIDTNHDGQVSPEERKAAFAEFAKKRFEALDKNKDGALTKDEVGDKHWEHLSVADVDKNGSVTRQEIDSAVAAGTLKFPHRGPGHRRHGDAQGEPGSGPGADPGTPDAGRGT